MRKIELGICLNNDGHYAFEVYRLGTGEKIMWAQTSTGLIDVQHMFLLDQDQSEYKKADIISVSPLEGIGIRPARYEEMRDFITGLVSETRRDVLFCHETRRIK